MTTTALEPIGRLLGEVGAAGSFTARRTAGDDDLHLEVKGIGRLRFPISRAQAQRLCRLARPARYGRGERTLLDRRVRDTWEVPKSRVKIDKRRWNGTLLPVLDALRADLGLPEGSRLKAELHGMLVYAPGQFFLPHQDSERADEMVGTLVVTLPASFKGGAIVVEHQGEKVTYRATRRPLSFIAFYADCRHEVRPVKEGYRIVLTYDLMVEGDGAGAAAPGEAAKSTIDSLARLLREHFETPLPSRRHWDEDAPPREPPNRLVYLLDHQYTERGVGWHRLKGDDAARAAALREAAERTGCEMALALAEVHETWGCMEPGWNQPRYGRHRRWERDEDDEWEADDEPPPPDDPDAYELDELYDWELTLDRWVDASGKKTEPIGAQVRGEEVCASTPTSALEPYRSEYEGYMGNDGNTMDRWYRRGAIVLWPRERSFAVRAEGSPAWALEELKRRIRAGGVPDAREMAKSLLPFWQEAAPREERRGFFDKALGVAEGLDRPELAASLLQPLRVEALTRRGAPALAALVGRYGEGWARALLSRWSSRDRDRWYSEWSRTAPRDRGAFVASLRGLCEALRAADDDAGTAAARLLLRDSWEWLTKAIDEAREIESPSRRDQAMTALARPILGFLEGVAVVEAGDLRDEALAFLSAGENEPLLPCLVRVLRAADETAGPARRAAPGLDVLGRHCARLLEARLAKPARREDDWSIDLPRSCDCELCDTLDAFLADPRQQRLEWPIAKERRRHVHYRLDLHELPVLHETRRKGRPYTLVLTKTSALFAQEAEERRSWQADLARLTRQGRAGSPKGGPGAKKKRKGRAKR